MILVPFASSFVVLSNETNTLGLTYYMYMYVTKLRLKCLSMDTILVAYQVVVLTNGDRVTGDYSVFTLSWQFIINSGVELAVCQVQNLAPVWR